MSLIASAVSSGVHWGISSSVAGIVKHKIHDFIHEPTNTTSVVQVQQRTVYSSSSGRCHGTVQSVTMCETYIDKEPSKASKALKAAKKSVKTSFAKVKDAIRQH